MPKSEALRILVVEDHHDSRVMLQRLLEHQGHVVSLAHSVETALEVAKSTQLDMVIGDIELPDGDGCELMRTLKETWGVPGIAVSGHADAEHRRRAALVGVCVHLCKPIQFEDLLDAIEECRAKDSTAGVG